MARSRGASSYGHDSASEPTFARGTHAPQFEGGRFEPARLLHVRVDLPRSVDGPLVIGDGRWLGLGVMARAEPPGRTLALMAVSEGAVSVTDVHAQGRRLHAAIAATMDGVAGADPLALLGRNGEVTAACHGHAHLLFLDLDRDDRLDHVLIWIPDGVAPASLEVLERLRRLWTVGRPSDDLELVLVADGERDTLARSFPALAKTLGPAATWTSATPFVAPRHVKPTGRNSLEGQVRWLAEQRGLPSPVVDLLDPAGFSDFGIADGRHRPPTAHRHRLRLRFPRAVSGPICLGFGAHHGLGRFEADE
jgi:CRISPR-associated protein Csb2